MNKYCFMNSETNNSEMLGNYNYLCLVEGEIQAWIFDLARAFHSNKNLTQILSSEEKFRADKFHFEKDRRHFVTRRGLLRIILGKYLDEAPELLKFSQGKYGKLNLGYPQKTPWIHFNLSHSGEICMYVFTCSREIGVDIEQIRYLQDRDLIAKHFLSNKEYVVFSALEENEKTEAFFNSWVRKEAFIKAKGIGLSCPLESLEVTLIPGEPARLVTTKDISEETGRWTLYEINPLAGYAGAIVVHN